MTNLIKYQCGGSVSGGNIWKLYSDPDPTCSRINSDPAKQYCGSGSAWILNFCLDPEPAKYERSDK